MAVHVGKTIRRLRDAKGWNLDDLASAASVDRGTLNRIELGKQKPHRATLRAIVTALDVRPEDVTSDPRLLEALDDTPSRGRPRGDLGIEDRLADLIAYVKTLKGKTRSDFIRASIALLTALEHSSAAAASGAAPNNER